jgi:N-acetylglucosaminyldiphosphoundecaprenol N-acetyl-beta-D-mannosaminyltransferase
MGRDSTAKVNILGTLIDNVTMGEAVSRICDLIEERRFSYVVTPNVDHVVKLRHDREFREIYEEASLAVSDSMPLVWSSRILGTPLKERVNGTDLMLEVCKAAEQRGYSVFLLGGDKGVAQEAIVVLGRMYPRIRIAGYYFPKYGFEKDYNKCLRIQKLIANSRADILFVALGAPKQEKWIQDYGSECKARMAIGVGASFSFISGALRRAPRCMQRSGLEWLWRLFLEPRRLWRRYILADMPFLWLIVKELVLRRSGRT